MKTLYHYCSSHAFHAIVSNSSLRLSSMTLSNDSQEGYWSVKMIEEACMKLINGMLSGFTYLHVTAIIDEIKTLRDHMDGLGICFSTEEDTLSQWRGYADDARGFSIGFSRERLDQMARNWTKSCKLIKVKYDAAEALGNFEQIAIRLKQHALEGAFDRFKLSTFIKDLQEISPERFKQEQQIGVAYLKYVETTAHLISDELYSYKNPAFKEEQEWRLLNNFHSRITGAPVDAQFDAKSDVLKPFRTLKIEDNFKDCLTKVMIGPKNRTPQNTIEAFLHSAGFVNVEVTKSSASYQ